MKEFAERMAAFLVRNKETQKISGSAGYSEGKEAFVFHTELLGITLD